MVITRETIAKPYERKREVKTEMILGGIEINDTFNINFEDKWVRCKGWVDFWYTLHLKCLWDVPVELFGGQMGSDLG